MPDLPFGTVTFFFTDIEGSTRLWEQHPDAMRLALARHDSLLRAAIETYGGSVFKTIGDAFCAAFPTATQALDAALLGQQHLQDTAPSRLQRQLELKVRMALHTGEAEVRSNDYFGPSLNRVARLLAIGHGGQILISAATQELVRDDLPANASLVELGSHRLRDLGRPEQVFQLRHRELAGDFPPLRSLASFPNNLPEQVTSFVGREREMLVVRNLLAATRLLTLAGPGGTGKTRLAFQAAADVLSHYRNGVWLVELAPLSAPELVTQTVAATLGVKEEGGRPLGDTLAEYLKEQQLLLLLDNCEHVLASCAGLVSSLLQGCPDLRILCTSREPLNLEGESTYRVPSLSLPEPRKVVSVAALSQYEAVSLFIERARAAVPTFRVTDENAPAVAQICCRLDGIPLALELAAARVRMLGPEQLLERLDNRFRLLTGGRRNALPRQQTLRAMIDWSYDLLTDQEKAIFQGLSVFVGGWELAAAEQVCANNGIEDWEVLDVLSSLAEKSLVQVNESHVGERRYHLLETVRQYAWERLQEAGEKEASCTRHRDYFLNLAAAAEDQMQGAGSAAAIPPVRTEMDNFRAALQWSLEEPHGAEAALRLGAYLNYFWAHEGSYSEGRDWLVKALAKAEGVKAPPAWQARALAGAAWFTLIRGLPEPAQQLAESGVRAAEGCGDYDAVLQCGNVLGGVLRLRGDLKGARDVFQEALAHAASRPTDYRRGTVLVSTGLVEGALGEYESAVAHLEEAIRLHRHAGRLIGVAVALRCLSEVQWRMGDYAGALRSAEESLQLSQQFAMRQDRAQVLTNLGAALLEQGEWVRAEAVLVEGLREHREMGDTGEIIWVAYFLGLTYCRMGRTAEARPVLRECLGHARELGILDAGEYLEAVADFVALELPAPGGWGLVVRLTGAAATIRERAAQPCAVSAQRANDLRIAAAQAALGEELFQREWESGRELDWDRAMLLALKACGDV